MNPSPPPQPRSFELVEEGFEAGGEPVLVLGVPKTKSMMMPRVWPNSPASGLVRLARRLVLQ